MDFVVRVEHLPLLGQTVLGRDFVTTPGGKGANQAYAAGKLGGIVRMVGCVGDDVFGQQLKTSLVAAGVDVSNVRSAAGRSTGVAFICVDQAGQNSIVVAPGANAALLPPDAEAFRGCGVVLCQLESPLTTVEAALRMARKEGAQTILDPAPAQSISFQAVDFLTPNESEAATLLGHASSEVSLNDAPAVAAALRAQGAKSVILKLGDRGCFYADGTQQIHVPAFSVNVVDSTAAGDTFNGALAVALSESQPIKQALRFANAAAALSVSRSGAQSSVPTRTEVEQLLRQNLA